MMIEELREDLRSLVMVWASCCCSPVIYLGAAWLCQTFDWAAWRPVSADTWMGLLIGLTVLSIFLQIAHVFIKTRFNRKLRDAGHDGKAILQSLTRRTYILMAISEAPVMLGFLLFGIQGDVTPVFGFGLVSMILYAQSHPKNGLAQR